MHKRIAKVQTMEFHTLAVEQLDGLEAKMKACSAIDADVFTRFKDLRTIYTSQLNNIQSIKIQIRTLKVHPEKDKPQIQELLQDAMAVQERTAAEMMATESQLVKIAAVPASFHPEKIIEPIFGPNDILRQEILRYIPVYTPGKNKMYQIFKLKVNSG